MSNQKGRRAIKSLFFASFQNVLPSYENNLSVAHYSKSQIFVQKFNFDKNNFHEFFTKKFSREVKVVNS